MALPASAIGQVHTLHQNPVNLVFVGTVNRGMQLHTNHDAVLLNADTLVADGWLDRLRGAAYSRRNIATVTPFSNNASIASFPMMCSENALPTGFSLAEVKVNVYHFIAADPLATLRQPVALSMLKKVFSRKVVPASGCGGKTTYGTGAF